MGRNISLKYDKKKFSNFVFNKEFDVEFAIVAGIPENDATFTPDPRYDIFKSRKDYPVGCKEVHLYANMEESQTIVTDDDMKYHLVSQFHMPILQEFSNLHIWNLCGIKTMKTVKFKSKNCIFFMYDIPNYEIDCDLAEYIVEKPNKIYFQNEYGFTYFTSFVKGKENHELLKQKCKIIE